jgi:hypothetical protein
MHSCWCLLLIACAALLLQQQTCSANESLNLTTRNADATQQLPQVTQQAHGQQLIATVLAAVDAGTVKASSALSLLRDLSSLRQSFESGAAAARWQQRQAAAAANSRQQQQQGIRRGILIVAGGSHQLRNAYILIKTLLHPGINCTLPIEVVYYGYHEFDAAAADVIQQLARTAGVAVQFIDGSTVPPTGSLGLDPHKAPGRLTGFKAKVHALVWVTSFDHVSEAAGPWAHAPLLAPATASCWSREHPNCPRCCLLSIQHLFDVLGLLFTMRHVRSVGASLRTVLTWQHHRRNHCNSLFEKPLRFPPQ